MSAFRSVLNDSRNLNLATYYDFGWDQPFCVKTPTTFSVRLEVNSRVSRTQNMKSERKKCFQKELCRRKKHTHSALYFLTFLYVL